MNCEAWNAVSEYVAKAWKVNHEKVSNTHHGDDGLDSFRRGLFTRGCLDEGASQIFEGEPGLGRILGFLPVCRACRTALYAFATVRQRPFLA